jgi:hypothetical protein
MAMSYRAVMHALWTLAGVIMLGTITATLRWSLGRAADADLGFVSQQWLAEHRQSESHYQRG